MPADFSNDYDTDYCSEGLGIQPELEYPKRHCSSCGSERLRNEIETNVQSSQTRYYYICKDCGWSEYI
jgi:predicted RNA-binding Zn-ribbon protein involved in translation (DUF1610 family)